MVHPDPRLEDPVNCHDPFWKEDDAHVVQESEHLLRFSASFNLP